MSTALLLEYLLSTKFDFSWIKWLDVIVSFFHKGQRCVSSYIIIKIWHDELDWFSGDSIFINFELFKENAKKTEMSSIKKLNDTYQFNLHLIRNYFPTGYENAHAISITVWTKVNCIHLNYVRFSFITVSPPDVNAAWLLSKYFFNYEN